MIEIRLQTNPLVNQFQIVSSWTKNEYFGLTFEKLFRTFNYRL